MSNLLFSILSSISGSTVLMCLFGWIGKRHLDKAIENERKMHQAELELYRSKLKNEERFFEHLFKASMDLYKIRQFVLPRRNHPDDDWDDALEIIASNFKPIEETLIAFIESNYAALPPEIIEKLNNAIDICSEGWLTPNIDQRMLADILFIAIEELCSSLKSIVDEKRPVDISVQYRKKNCSK